MPTTDPLTGTTIPLDSDAPDGPGQIKAAVFGLSDNTIPYYTSTALRDAAFSSWVANGGSMRNSLMCAVGTTLYQYRSGAWNAVPTDYETKMMRAQRNINNDAFPTGSWTNFASDVDWTETDPWGMRSTGSTLVAPWTGWYQINATIYWAAAATGARGLSLSPGASVNIGEGSGQLLNLAVVPTSGASNATVVSGAHLTALTAGNTVQLAGYQNSGSNLTVNAVRFSVAYLGPNT